MALQAVALTVLLLPAAGALVLALSALRIPRWVAWAVGPGVVWAAFLLVAAVLLPDTLSNPQPHDFTYWTWIKSGTFAVPASLYVDRLAVFMCLVVTGVGGLIVTYAVGYMEHETDASYARFFCYMDLFIFSMLLLVLAGNMVFLIMGWALVGLSSYLLIGFWYWRYSAVVAARKAFVMNVIGDVGLILATFAIFVQFRQVTYTGVFAALPHADNGWLEVIGFLLLLGAIAKSAQIPLHTWLPDAMEGPTPVSALIHAATMVTAGVYLIGRMHPIYDVATYAQSTAAIIGALTAFVAATIAIVQVDIKRVLAYSTMSQIGYMFLGVGIGAYSAGFYHLLSHAFFKALLFLAAGNVIHAMRDEQDMRKFGGLWRQMRWTSVCFLIGSLSLVGIIPFIGFWSKEVILGDAFSKPGFWGLAQWLWLSGFVTALLTGFYTGRMWWLSFAGKPSPERPVEHPHEAPPVMLVPVVILAVLTTVGGLVQVNAGFHQGWKLVEDFLAPPLGHLPWEARDLEYFPTAATLLLGGLTFLLAYNFYVRHVWRPWSEQVPRLQRFLQRKWYFDDAYDAVFVRPMDEVATDGDRYLEEPVLDGAPAAVGLVAESSAGGLSLVQNGYFRTYALVFMGGAVIGGILLLVVRASS
jgi:NADH-quinone oxidoreductase subunit L